MPDVTMEFDKHLADGEPVTVRSYYTESKIAVTGGEGVNRKQFFWGEDEMFDNEIQALKAAISYCEGLAEGQRMES